MRFFERFADAREEGFTLLEVLVAMTIFAIGSLGVLSLVMTSMTLNSQSRNFAEASVLGQWKLDELMTTRVDATIYTDCATVSANPQQMCRADSLSRTAAGYLTSGAGSVSIADIGGTGSNSQYQVFWSQTLLTAGAENGLYALHVVVRWPHKTDLGGVPAGGANFLACDDPANTAQCYSIEFNAYRRPPST